MPIPETRLRQLADRMPIRSVQKPFCPNHADPKPMRPSQPLEQSSGFADASSVSAQSCVGFTFRRLNGQTGADLMPSALLSFLLPINAEPRLMVDNDLVLIESGSCLLCVNKKSAQIDVSGLSDNGEVLCCFGHVALSDDASSMPTISQIPASNRLRTLLRFGIEIQSEEWPAGELLIDAIGQAVIDSYVSASGWISKLPPFLHRALAYAKCHFREDCDLSALADAAGVTRGHLVDAFRRHLGTTPMRYLWNLRTQQAVSLVRSTDFNLAEIAEKSGYKSPYHLSREIKKSTGMTPSRLRNGSYQVARHLR